LLRVDGLSAFFGVLVAVGAALLTADGARPWPTALAALALLAGCSSAHLGVAAAGFLVAALLAPLGDVTAGPRGARFVPLLASACLLLAVGWLWAGGGGWRYDLPAAGLAFTSPVFWFIVLATICGGTAALQAGNPWALSWFYPLLRLYSLGPWNSGWSFATLLLGGTAALWCAWRAASNPEDDGQQMNWHGASILGAALAGVGLSSAAGVAACCYGLICALLLPLAESPTPNPQPQAPNPQPQAHWTTLLLWPLTAALPLGAPFVAMWLGVGAAVAGGVSLLAVALWLAGLGTTLGQIRAIAAERGRPGRPRGPWLYRRIAAAALSIVLGVASPIVIAWPIMPVARQLQGGLTPFGDMAVWPWLGLAALDSARRPTTSLPSLAVAGLMLVLAAMAWLLAVWLRSRE
jgi:MFS family permease